MTVEKWANLKNEPHEFVFVDSIRCLKVYKGVSHQGASFKTAAERNKYYGSSSNKIEYYCPLETERGLYKMINISYFASFSNYSLEQGSDMSSSFADLNRRVQRSINSLKISRKDYFDKVNYRK